MHIPLYTYIFISRYDTTQYCILVDIHIPTYILCAHIYTHIRMGQSLQCWVNSTSCYCQHTLIWNVSARDIT